MIAALKEAGEGTISTWVKVENEKNEQNAYLRIVGLLDADGNPLLALERKWYFLAASTKGDAASYDANSLLSNTEWVHLRLTANDNSVELYLNGQKQSVTGPAVEHLFDSVDSIQIGGTIGDYKPIYGGFENVYILAEYADAALV